MTTPPDAAPSPVEVLAMEIVRDVCELTDLPDPDDDDCLRVTVDQLEAIILQRLEELQTTKGYALIHREHGVTEEMGNSIAEAMPDLNSFARKSWLGAAIAAAPTWSEK